MCSQSYNIYRQGAMQASPPPVRTSPAPTRIIERVANPFHSSHPNQVVFSSKGMGTRSRRGMAGKPTWIIGRVPCAPHTSESQLFSSQQHVLDSRSRSLDILDLQHLWLVRRFSHYYNDYGRA